LTARSPGRRFRVWPNNFHKIVQNRLALLSEESVSVVTGGTCCQVNYLDLGNGVRLNQSVEEIASFMCRSRREIRKKMAELGRSGELVKWVERAEAEALPDEPEIEESEDESGLGDPIEDSRA
jgi:hypothetical protein